MADPGPQPVPMIEPSITSQAWFLPVAIGAVGVGLFVLLVLAMLAIDADAAKTGRVRRRLSRYSLPEPEPESGNGGPTRAAVSTFDHVPVARSAIELAGRLVQTRDLDTAVGTRLEAAGLPLRPAEWLVIHIGTAVLIGFALLLLTSFSLLAGMVGVAIGVVAPLVYLDVRRNRRTQAFAEQLPDTLQLLAGSISAGYSLPQATDVVVRESGPPMSVELGRALVEARLGVPLEDSLETIAVRMDSVDFAWVVMAIRVQREVGGNLAEVLKSVANTMRERERLRRQIQVLSAEGRLSAIILIALPLLFIGYLVLVRPDYISRLVTTPLGVTMSVIGVGLLVAGVVWLRHIVRVKV